MHPAWWMAEIIYVRGGRWEDEKFIQHLKFKISSKETTWHTQILKILWINVETFENDTTYDYVG
jgi:hypothetical protein